MDRLTTYRAKRHFGRTTEPEGKLGKPSRGGLYVIHEHDATRLHYDLRLEHDGVLLSWAVTRGPSLDPEEKRLAVQVEDHPIDYGSFEGLIPEGNYGAGTVSQWDRGRWIPEGDTTKGLKKGHLTFRLEGEKLKGDWHLVRTRRRQKEKRGNWLLIKSKDEYAVPGAKGEIVKIATKSVKTGRTLAEIRRERKSAEAATGGKARVPKFTVTLSHPDRVLWPEAGLSKQGLLDHYAAVWDLMKPYVIDRPLALLRAPGGIGGGQFFFQKYRSPGMHEAIGEIKDPKDGEGLIVIRDFDGLAALVQFGVVEIHLSGSSADAIEKPDQMIFDLDPDKGVDWKHVIEAAEEIRRRLIQVKLVPFLKTSGGKGLHVVVPLKPDADWARVKDFSKALAEQLARDFPDRYTANMSKKARPGKIFVDYLRNGRGSTAVAPCSTRARGKAPVAVPIAWEELGLGVRADQFQVGNLLHRLDHLSKDPWAGFRKAARPLPEKP